MLWSGRFGGRLVVEIDHVAEIDGRLRDLLVLAELPVGGLQIGKIDAAERLALADGLRVVQRGRDQVVEVDVLDVEGLAHMGAAGAQQLRHLRLVPRRGRTRSSPRPAWSSTWLSASAVAKILTRSVSIPSQSQFGEPDL